MWGSLLGALLLGVAAWASTPVVLRHASSRTSRTSRTGTASSAPPTTSPWVRRRAHVPLAAVAGAGVMALPAGPVLTATLAVAALGLALLVTVDLAVHRLPDRLVAALAVVVLAGLLAATLLGEGTWSDLGRAAGAGVAVGAGFLVLCLLTPSGLGLGDVKLAGVLALPLGWFSWSAVLAGLVLSFVTGGLVALALLLARRADRRTPIAFGPFLGLGAALAVAAAAMAPA
ncbi:prepilin peptidase [Ruania suaedae]|uniref:prepilin peptidase n=1 Tax=Ruania suaedae TaxID=2897774 RepID=UPI001E33500B|nr:prepilin peptidase [Ruania suaedae]UFU01552.1 prepilin peptidase [Ruania suaedae]